MSCDGKCGHCIRQGSYNNRTMKSSHGRAAGSKAGQVISKTKKAAAQAALWLDRSSNSQLCQSNGLHGALHAKGSINSFFAVVGSRPYAFGRQAFPCDSGRGVCDRPYCVAAASMPERRQGIAQSICQFGYARGLRVTASTP